MNYLYQITNLVNNKIYIGIHKTDDINDGYMGSGKVIKSAIKKYGVENFKKDILEFFDTYRLALEKEAEIVTDEFLLREDVYNLRRGGTGGFDYINKHIVVNRSQISKDLWKSAEYIEKQSLLDRSLFKQKGKTSFLNKVHTTKSKASISESCKGLNTGNKNSQFGTVWVTNEIENLKIKAESPIPHGWRRGRVIRGQ
jgi:GIY-YIG catalytic domain